jgi:hypothetical protein
MGPEPELRPLKVDLEGFAATVTIPRLRDRLEVALGGRGAFRRFKDVLVRFQERSPAGTHRGLAAQPGYRADPRTTFAVLRKPPGAWKVEQLLVVRARGGGIQIGYSRPNAWPPLRLLGQRPRLTRVDSYKNGTNNRLATVGAGRSLS